MVSILKASELSRTFRTFKIPNVKTQITKKNAIRSKISHHIQTYSTTKKFGSVVFRNIQYGQFTFTNRPAIQVYTTSSIAKIIEEQIKKAPVVVYMKGTPENPACGFSKAVTEVLRRENVIKYDYYNVLEDDKLRQGIKKYSNWPTIPQVYVEGEFLGGCDIILEMHQEGTLTGILKKANAVTSAPEK